MPNSHDFSVKGKSVEGFDYGRRRIKRNKELNDFVDKLCVKLGLKEHTLIFSCNHPPPSYYYTPDRVLKEVEYIKNERDQLRDENSNLKIEFDVRIAKLEKEKNKNINELEKNVLRLREIINKKYSDWQIDWDIIWRINPITKKIERYDFPLDFDENNVKIEDFTDDKSFMCYFKYFFSDKENDFEEYDMPFDLLKALPSLLKKTGKAISSKNINFLELEYKKKIKAILDKSGENIDNLEHLDKAIGFLFKVKGEKFKTGDFQRESKISSPSTVQIYLKMLIRCKLIVKFKTGWYRVKIK